MSKMLVLFFSEDEEYIYHFLKMKCYVIDFTEQS